jgi:hypothetical protein
MSLFVLFAIGCAAGPYGAPAGSTIQVSAANFDTEGYVFDGAYNDPDDGIGLLIREFAIVTLPATENYPYETPGNDIRVEITSGWSAAYVLPATAIETVTTYSDGCEGDRSEECAAWFDIGTESYVEFSGEYKDLGGLRPTYMSGGTDNRGILDFYVFIDSVPVDDEGEVITIPLYASIGVDIVSWSYDFQ